MCALCQGTGIIRRETYPGVIERTVAIVKWQNNSKQKIKSAGKHGWYDLSQ